MSRERTTLKEAAALLVLGQTEFTTRPDRTRGEVTVRTPTFSVEVITLPVSDVEQALRF
jgi:hypothetical protein